MESKFSWTQEYRRSWEEDVKTQKINGSYEARSFNPNRKCIIRHLLVSIDTSSSIEKSDYVPTVRNIVANAIPRFAELFRTSNPLSIMSFITCRNVFEKHSKSFDADVLLNTVGSKDFSFLNCLKSGIEFLKDTTYTRELLIITASIGTKDSGAYDRAVQDIKKYGIKVNVVSICGEVTLFKKICEMSGGLFFVPMDPYHLDRILARFTEPLESLESTSNLVKLGFPRLYQVNGICSCHLKFERGLYECPVCRTYVCSLPAQCPICETQLVTPLSISKSYYFLYPLKPFDSCDDGICKKCGSPSKSKCPECRNTYCAECDYFLHKELNFCVFCDK